MLRFRHGHTHSFSLLWPCIFKDGYCYSLLFLHAAAFWMIFNEQFSSELLRLQRFYTWHQMESALNPSLQKKSIWVFFIGRGTPQPLACFYWTTKLCLKQYSWLVWRLMQPWLALLRCFIKVCFLFLTRRLITEVQRRSLVLAEYRTGVHWQLWWGVLWRQRLVLLLTYFLHPFLSISTGNGLQSHISI